jgi:hypothetical protein
MNNEKIPIGAIFQHYNGKKYRVLMIGRHSEDLKPYVVYQGLYDCDSFGNCPIWIRPLEMFLENVEKEGKQIKRFELVELPIEE